MRQITIEAPSGFEFDSTEPVTINDGQWYCVFNAFTGEALAYKADVDAMIPEVVSGRSLEIKHYRLRKESE